MREDRGEERDRYRYEERLKKVGGKWREWGREEGR
jgi:hypothetical protein